MKSRERAFKLFFSCFVFTVSALFVPQRWPFIYWYKGCARELSEIEGRDPLRHRWSRASRRYDGDTPRTVRCVPVFVQSEKSNVLVGGGFLQPALRSANLDSAFGGMHLFATEAWRAVPLLLTHSAQLTQPTVRLPQL